MSDVIIGSARMGENGSITGGKKGDQKQTGKDDYKGEVSLQKFYVHKKGWYILRPKSPEVANALAIAMYNACNNKNIGYNQSQRLDIMKTGTQTTVPTNCDCSSLVRKCILEASGKDVGNFTTYNEALILVKSALFREKERFTSNSTLYTGDVLVTCSKGHTVIVTKGKNRTITPEVVNALVYPAYKGNSKSIVTALQEVGEKDTSKTHRAKIAKANGISGYNGTAVENTKMLELLKKGLLKRGI